MREYVEVYLVDPIYHNIIHIRRNKNVYAYVYKYMNTHTHIYIYI